jgi:hypothetical protein
MKRSIIGWLMFASLLLCLGTTSAWIRSHFTQDVWVKTTAAGRHYELATLPGQFRLTIGDGWINPAPWRWYHGTLPNRLIVLGHRPIYEWYWYGIAVHGTSGTTYDYSTTSWFRGTYKTYAVPFFWPIALTLLLPACVAVRSRRFLIRQQFRRVRGLCPSCGYDLRATPQRCPECGYAP